MTMAMRRHVPPTPRTIRIINASRGLVDVSKLKGKHQKEFGRIANRGYRRGRTYQRGR